MSGFSDPNTEAAYQKAWGEAVREGCLPVGPTANDAFRLGFIMGAAYGHGRAGETLLAGLEDMRNKLEGGE